jgi:hypothetical protein
MYPSPMAPQRTPSITIRFPSKNNPRPLENTNVVRALALPSRGSTGSATGTGTGSGSGGGYGGPHPK